MLYREPKLLKEIDENADVALDLLVSVLYREPKLLKVHLKRGDVAEPQRFSALP